MLGHLIALIGLPVLIDIIGRALYGVKHPAAKSASEALGNLGGVLTGGTIPPEQIAQANSNAQQIAQNDYLAYESTLREVNETYRTELSSDDKYVRRMRPTFGYLLAFSWAAQMLGLAYIIVFETEKSVGVLSSMEALSAIWAMGLSVLGVYVYKRSEEKKISSGALIGSAVRQIINPPPPKPNPPAPPVPDKKPAPTRRTNINRRG